METLLLDRADVRENVRMSELIPAVADAFAAHARGDAVMPAKSYVDLPEYGGDFRSMPAYLAADGWDAAGVKWVNVHPDNPDAFDLPTVLGTMIYSDPRNGFPLAIMDGATLTRLRTGAASGVATDHLAVTEARSLGMVGAGVHATLGEIVRGEQPGREPGDGITVFDSTGLAIQDVAAAHVAYERAEANDEGTPFALVDTERR